MSAAETDPGGEAAHRARRAAAKGASSVALSRLGTVVDVVSQPAYSWMFGLPTYGLYMVLWSLVNVAENIFDLGTTSALQRILPRSEDPDARARAVRAALLLGILPNLAVAALACALAPRIAPLLNVDARDLPRLVTAIRLFAWALPLWATVEVATSAVRACRAFGPEVRLRLMWEQVARLCAAGILWVAGVHTLGLLIAHLISLSITAAAALRLLHRFVPLDRVAALPAGGTMLRDMFLSGVSVLPSNILGRVFSDMATVVANLLAPGASGARAAAIYAIARKISSIPQIVRQTFGYVLGPIAAAAERGDRATVQALYDFAVRLSLLLAVPTCAALIAAGPALLGLFAHGAEAGLSILAILTASRGIEAMVGPASSIQQVIGRRMLPVVNSLVAFGAATLMLALTARALPGIAIALAVATGQVSVAALSIGQLAREEGLHAFGRDFWPRFLIAAGASALLLGCGAMGRHAPAWLLGTAILLLWPVTLWTALRFGLTRADKRALGGFGRKFRLASHG